uniref:Uncharacterized protein n=1 Tax=Trichogramma kaykai TaxID=54128 RepID=A0ABD2X4C2_9HYME
MLDEDFFSDEGSIVGDEDEIFIDGLEDFVDHESLECLKSMSEKVNFEIEEERNEFLREVDPLIINWQGKLPNLRDIFRVDELESLLLQSVNYLREVQDDQTIYQVRRFIKFVIHTGYRDEPKFDEEGKPLLNRKTALHIIGRFSKCQIINRITDDLFQIYNRFDVNYTDDTGFTHFHAACYNGRRRVVQQFLECHQDPNCIWTETGATPLHAALFRASRKTAKLLLTYGADPNFADRRTGGTSLHMLTWDGYADDYGAEMFFEYSNDQYKPVQVNALDKWNMTPLEWAVANALPNTAKVFLDNGADLSDFVFPSAHNFGGVYESYADEIDYNSRPDIKLGMGAGALAVAELLEERGYELERSDAQAIMSFFIKRELFQKPEDLDIDCIYNDNEFVTVAKDAMILPNLSLYDLIALRPDEAEKRLTYMDYCTFARSNDFRSLPEKFKEVCAMHLCEKLSRGLFERWTLYFYSELIRYRLTVVPCRLIIENWTNKDLCNICLAVINDRDSDSDSDSDLSVKRRRIC